jgi:hypothetical protein
MVNLELLLNAGLGIESYKVRWNMKRPSKTIFVILVFVLV